MTSPSSFRAFGLAAVTIAAGLAAFGTTAISNDGNLEGSWSGSGKIFFPSGETEVARCKANFKKQGGESYGMNAICATASARVVQTANISRLTANRFSGEFNNPDYGITGKIRITVSGSRMSAALEGGGGKAEFSLSK